MNFSVSARVSSTTMPAKAPLGTGGIVASADHAAAASTICVSQNETWRLPSPTKRSPRSTAHAPQRSRISGRTAAKSRSLIMIAATPSELALRDVGQQVRDRAVHHVDEGLRPQAHPEHEQGDGAQHPELAAIQVGECGDLVVA